MNYDPSVPGIKGSIFGFPYSEKEASIVIIPVPWDVTVSNHSGTSKGPQAILDSSLQLDLELFGIKDAWKTSIWMASISHEILELNNKLRKEIEPYLNSLENNLTPITHFQNIISKVNKAALNLKNQVINQSSKYLEKNKIVAVLGGEHSIALGLIEALSNKYNNFGILQIDAHMDLRKAYQGFEHSHASVMYNVMQLPQVCNLVQVGIRDYCPKETEYVKKAQNKIAVFYDEEIKSKLYFGTPWKKICENIINKLPEYVYISFDIDGLNPHLCTGTGTPVPGGMEYKEAIYLIKILVKSGRKIIGLDLCEVAPKENDKDWNGNVGARVLYNLCCLIN